MHFVRRTPLALALAAAVVGPGSPARADDGNTAPTATYQLDSTAIWAGQHVRLTESGFADDTTGSDPVTRTVAWGDGIVETVSAAPAGWSHTYAAPGTYAVAVTLHDGRLDGAGAFPTGSTVTVTAPGGGFAWRQSTVYTYPTYQAPAALRVSDVPPTATRVWTDWTDHETSLLGTGSTTLTHWFPTGSWTPRITLQNAQGRATPFDAGTLTVAEDTTPPWVTVTVPASPGRAGSWTTISGQAGDGESGLDVVGVQLWRRNSTAEYYYDFASRTWVRYYTGATPRPGVEALAPTDAAGTWRVGATGMARGYTLDVWYYAWDRVGNSTEAASVSYYLSS